MNKHWAYDLRDTLRENRDLREAAIAKREGFCLSGEQIGLPDVHPGRPAAKQQDPIKQAYRAGYDFHRECLPALQQSTNDPLACMADKLSAAMDGMRDNDFGLDLLDFIGNYIANHLPGKE